MKARLDNWKAVWKLWVSKRSWNCATKAKRDTTGNTTSLWFNWMTSHLPFTSQPRMQRAEAETNHRRPSWVAQHSCWSYSLIASSHSCWLEIPQPRWRKQWKPAPWHQSKLSQQSQRKHRLTVLTMKKESFVCPLRTSQRRPPNLKKTTKRTYQRQLQKRWKDSEKEK